MLKLRKDIDKETAEETLYTDLKGKMLLNSPQLNKGTAFTLEERHTLNLLGKLPTYVESLDEQITRAYEQYQSFKSNLKKNTYLSALHDSNQVLFYALVKRHLKEMIPTIYTPIVGTAVKQFSHEFRRSRGLYIANTNIDYIDEVLANRTNPEIDIIVVTDGEGVLGIGDQGIGGMDIPIAKLMVYSLCGDVDHLRTLPICLDVGTDNQALLDDPLYLGLKHQRIRGKAYQTFIDRFVQAVKKAFPWVFLHWEDFGRDTARLNLDTYRDQLCSFNDDIQGTGVITVAALQAAVIFNKSTLAEQQVVIFGAGSAGTGIADQICAAMVHSGISQEEAIKRFWLIDRQGLLQTNTSMLTPAQEVYAKDPELCKDWPKDSNGLIDLATTIAQTQASVLLGTSAVTGAFKESIVKSMYQHHKNPIIFPLSNPTERAEATPFDLLTWTEGNALIATGSPFDAVLYQQQKIKIAQCNNALAFPGIGIAMVGTHAKRLTDKMLWTASQSIAEHAPILKDPRAALLPDIEDAEALARNVAKAMIQTIRDDKMDTINQDLDIDTCVQQQLWQPIYPNIKPLP
jgi:malate dehydrogenase (oxaloacetate-decarboxylating)